MDHKHEAEAAERWGDTEAYRESQRRTSAYTKADWQQMKAESERLEQHLADLMRSGSPATGPDAMAAAEAHRLTISRWFYACDYGMHRGLADMYVSDPRFTAHYDERAPGLAAYLRAAVHANAAEHGTAG